MYIAINKFTYKSLKNLIFRFIKSKYIVLNYCILFILVSFFNPGILVSGTTDIFYLNTVAACYGEMNGSEEGYFCALGLMVVVVSATKLFFLLNIIQLFLLVFRNETIYIISIFVMMIQVLFLVLYTIFLISAAATSPLIIVCLFCILIAGICLYALLVQFKELRKAKRNQPPLDNPIFD